LAARAGSVGIIANPASGKDIRRLVGHASVFDNNEKVLVVRRLLLALDAAGVRDVLAMRDYYQIVARAADGLALGLTIDHVDGLATREEDTTTAAAALEAAGVAVIVTLGGDGTNRAAALGARATPFVPVSTGTNNVFPTMVEGGVAGLAAAALATGLVAAAEVATPSKSLRLALPAGDETLALIDIAVLTPGFVGARAIWEPQRLRRILLTRASPASVGLAGLGGLLCAVTPAEDCGLDITLGGGEGPLLDAPLAPGLFAPVQVSGHRSLALGEAVTLAGPCLLALDGERGVEVSEGEAVTVTLLRDGPPVVDINLTLTLAAQRGLLRR